MKLNIFSKRQDSSSTDSGSKSGAKDSNVTPDSGSSLFSTARTRNNLSGIPKGLSFDQIIAGSTCPPMTCRDFMRYLVYVEHCAENLQFYLWFKDYEKRFTELSKCERDLSPQYIPVPTEPLSPPGLSVKDKIVKQSQQTEQFICNAFNSSDLSDPSAVGMNPKAEMELNTPPRTASSSAAWKENYTCVALTKDGSIGLRNLDYKQVTAQAFEKANLKWQPFSVQPFRDEISRIIAIYIAEGSPRELNLSSRDRDAVLNSLAQTTHPSAFRDVLIHIEGFLRFQSHPNFVRWSITNSSSTRRRFSAISGGIIALVGVLASILITLSGVNRFWRALGTMLLSIGLPGLFAGTHGVCLLLVATKARHIHPWELWKDDVEASGSQSSFDTSSSNKNNSQDEPWILHYEKRPSTVKFFDKTIPSKDRALKRLQISVTIKSHLISWAIAGIVGTIFFLVPGGHLKI